MESKEILKQKIEELNKLDCSIIDLLDSFESCKNIDFVVAVYSKYVNEDILPGDKMNKIRELFMAYEGVKNSKTIYPLDNKIVTLYEFTIKDESTYLFVLDIPLYDRRFLFTVYKGDYDSVIQWLSKTKLVIDSHKEKCKSNIRDCYVIAMQYLHDHGEIVPVFIDEWDFLEYKA